MIQSQHVAHYNSDSENDIDMQTQPSSNTEAVKRNKKNMRKWIPLCTYNNNDDVINKIGSKNEILLLSIQNSSNINHQ